MAYWGTPGSGHPRGGHAGTSWLMPASVPATAPGEQEPMARACLGFSHPTGVLLMCSTLEHSGPHPTRVLPVPKHPRTTQPAPTSASVIFPGYPTERELWDHPSPCPLQLQLSYTVCSTPGPLEPTPHLSSSCQPEHPLHKFSPFLQE